MIRYRSVYIHYLIFALAIALISESQSSLLPKIPMKQYKSAESDVELDPQPTSITNDIQIQKDNSQNPALETDAELTPKPDGCVWG
jgi:hypothetical protein